MDQTITITLSLADVIPAITGTMVFTAVLLTMNGSRKGLRWSWALGGTANLLLPTFGLLTGHATFTFHIPVACAFAFVLCRSLLKRQHMESNAQAVVAGSKTS